MRPVVGNSTQEEMLYFQKRDQFDNRTQYRQDDVRTQQDWKGKSSNSKKTIQSVN